MTRPGIEREYLDHLGVERGLSPLTLLAYGRDLRRLFSDEPEYQKNPKASRVIHQMRRDVRRLVAAWTGSYQYTIDRVIEDMVARAKELNLRLKYPLERTKRDFTVLITVQTMNHLHSGRHRLAL